MNTPSNVEEVYKNLLNSAELSKEDVAKMTEDDVNKLLKASDDFLNKNENLKVISQLPSNNGILINENPIEGEDVLVNVKVNPATGEKYAMENSNKESTEEEKDFISETFEEMLENPNYSPDNVVDLILPENIIKSNASDKFASFNEEDMLKFIELIKTYQAGDEKNLFNRLPESLQKEITKSYFENSGGVDLKYYKKMFAESIVESFIMESSIDKIQIDFQDELKKCMDDIGDEIKEYYSDEVQNRIKKLRKVSDNIKDTDPDKSKTLLDIAGMIEESYELNILKNTLATRFFRIKPFELEKPEKIFKEFNYKYTNSLYNIHNISMVPPILRNHFSEDEISDDQIMKFVIIFCKYTQNMKPTNIVEHSFMYYFIMNIISLSVFNHAETEFYDNLLKNIKECILLIK